MFSVEEGIFYHIYPLGFCGAPEKNQGEAPKNRLEKIEKWIPHMKSLGINCLYLGPVFQSGCHGYDTHDYREVDSRLGTNEDFKALCKKLRENEIHIVLDGVFNHVGRGFFAFEDLLKNRENSRYKDWFSGLHFGENNSYNDGLRYDSWAGHELLVKLNLRNPEVKNYLLDAVKMWVDEFYIEGLRLDAADCIDHDFFRELRKVTTEKNPEFWLMGEIIHGNYNVWVNEEMLHSVTNYECYKGFHSSVSSKNLFEIMHTIERQRGPYGIYKDMVLYNFLDNHDVNRIVSVLKNHKENLKNVYTIMYTVPGVPSIYYGSEWGIEGEKTKGNDAPLRPMINVDSPEIADEDLLAHIKELGKIRSESKALKKGNFERVNIQNESMVFARAFEDESVLVFINIASEEKIIYADYSGRHFEECLPAYASKIVKV